MAVVHGASPRGIDSLEGGYLATLVDELVDEFDLPDPELCSYCQAEPALDEGTYAGLGHNCAHEAHKEDEADRRRDDW